LRPDAEHVPYFTLVPVRGRPEVCHRGHRKAVFPERCFDANVLVAVIREQVVDDGEVARRLPLSVIPLTLVNGGSIVEGPVWPVDLSLQMPQDVVNLARRRPEARNFIAGLLDSNCLSTELLLEMRDDLRRHRLS